MSFLQHHHISNPLGGERRFYEWRGHRVAYVERGQPAAGQPPLVFVHSIHAAASSAEWRNIIEPLSQSHRCVVLDLLGFGASDRPPLHYTAQLYIDLIGDFLRDVVGQPATLVGSSLGATYAIAAAHAQPRAVHAVVAIGPAGITRLYAPGGALNRAVESLFRSEVPGAALFRALVSRWSIRQFLKGIYSNPAYLTPDAIEIFYNTAAHPNARFAPAAFVGMRLNQDIRVAVTQLSCPLLLVWGTQAAQTPYKEAAAVRRLLPAVSFAEIHAGDLPHEETPEAFLNALTPFLAAARTTA